MTDSLFSAPLIGEFEFGFELEGFVKYDKKQRHWDIYTARRVVYDYMKSYWENISGPYYDGSLNCFGKKDVPFEWPSPVMKLTPANISKVVDMLAGLKDIGVYTNNTCGLHIHYSFPFLTNEKAAWILCHLAMDKRQQERIIFMNKKGWWRFGHYTFYNKKYAGKFFLEKLEEHIRNRDYAGIRYVLSTSKFRMLRIHPQGTLEWRGPRSFLNHARRDEIHEFFMIAWEFAYWMKVALSTNHIDGIHQTEFMHKLQQYADMSWFPQDKNSEFVERWHRSMKIEHIKYVYRIAPWLKKAKFAGAKISWYKNNSGAMEIVWENGKWLSGDFCGTLWKNGWWAGGTWKGNKWILGDIVLPGTYIVESTKPPKNTQKTCGVEALC
jgi:hypothetical protein